MAIVTFSTNLDTNMMLVEESADGTLKATAYFEDFLFKLFQDIEAINVAAGQVLTLAIPGNVFTLTQSSGPDRTVNLSSLDGFVTALSIPGNILTLAQTTGGSPVTVNLASLDGRVLTLSFSAVTGVITLTQSTGTSPLTVDISGLNIARGFREQMNDRAFVHSEFFEPPAGFQAEGVQIVPAAGGFASVPTLPYDFTNHPGVWGLNTGATSAAGRVFVLSEFLTTFHVGVGGITRMGFWFQAPAILSTALQRFVLRAGVSSMALPNTINQGITFEYQDDQNGGRWQAICDDAPGVETSVDTGVLVVASVYYFLEIVVNAAGTSVEFFIDSVSVATIVTNIPSGLTFGHFISIHIMKLIGLGNRAPYIDAYYFNQELTR